MKNRKGNLWKIAFLLMATLCCVLLLVSCNGDAEPVDPNYKPPADPSQHTHNCVLTETVPATCTEDGYQTYACECGYSYLETLPLLGHKLAWASDDSGHWQQCERCDYKTEKETHSYDAVVSVDVPPTCTSDGSQTVRCECGKTVSQSIEKSAHSYTVTNYDDGEHWTECAVCHLEQTGSRAPHLLQVTTHSDATCTSDGVTVKECACGKTVKETSRALGHDLDKSEFSKKTDSGHFYLCLRCEQDVMEQHVTEDYPCESNKAPTCGEKGHQDKRCTVCEHVYHTVLPATGQHTWSVGDDLHYNGAQHWHYCTVCQAEADDREVHTWQWRTLKEPTCTENGSRQEYCVCGAVGKTSSIPLSGHKYEPDEDTRQQPTCTEKGSVKMVCSVCGDNYVEQLAALKHNWSSEWLSDENGHWHKCERCQVEQESKGNHNFRETARQSATCTVDGYYDEQCTACGYSRRTVIPAHHVWAATDDGRIDPTCTQLGSHVEHCSVCGQTQTVVDETLGYAPHQPREVAAKEATFTERGWYRHWTCDVCGQNFRTKNCEELYPDSELYIPATAPVVVDTIAELLEIAQRDYATAPSKTYYQITAQVFYCEDNVCYIYESDDLTAIVELDASMYYDLETVCTDELITVFGYLTVEGDEAKLTEAHISDVEDGIDELVHLQVSVNGKDDVQLSVTCGGTQTDLVYYSRQKLVLFNSLEVGEELTFTFRSYTASKLSRIVINGESYTMEHGTLSVEVTGNMVCEFDISEYTESSATVEEFALPFNAPAQKADAYVEYELDNNNADNPHIVKNSILRFTVRNAYITRVEIVFEDYELTEVGKNTVSVGKSKDSKTSVAYSIGSKNTATFIFNESDQYTYFEYSADHSQARIVSVRIYYNTYNS